MKRFVAILSVLALVCLMGVTALAAPVEVLTVQGDTTCAPGSTLTLAFGLTKDSKAQAVNVEVTYDTDTFEFVEYENGDVIANALAAGNGTDGKVLFTLATLTPIVEEGSMFTATFKVDSKATGDHKFFLYATSFNVDDGSSAGKDIEANTVEYVVSVKGETVSEVSVAPVYSMDENGAQSVVSAHDGEGEMGVVISSYQTTSSSVVKGEGNSESSTWVIVGVVVLAVGALALLVVAAVAKAKKGDKEEVENQSILTDEAKALLDLEPDALEEKQDKE